MLCWNSWANIRKLASKDWRFETFYWDYVWGIVITSLIFTFTFWSVGVCGRSFWADYQQADGQNIQSSLIVGVVFNTANILIGFSDYNCGCVGYFPRWNIGRDDLVYWNVIQHHRFGQIGGGNFVWFRARSNDCSRYWGNLYLERI